MIQEKESRVKNPTAFLDKARSRYQEGLDADYVDRFEAEADNVFANASDVDHKQWDDIPLRSRKDNHRPVLQWNRIPTYVQQVVNDGRQNKPAIKISQGDQGTKEDAEYYQDRIRQVEYDSNADIAYDTARDQQVTSGRGFIRIYTEYIPGTFDKRACIDRIENQFSVVFDPSAKCYDRSDADWCFVVTTVSEDAFERMYGKEALKRVLDWDAEDTAFPGWVTSDTKGKLIRLAEYWCKEYRKRTLCLLGSTGLPTWKDELTQEQYNTFKANGQILAEREEQDSSVCQYIIDGAEILEENEWLGSRIPIVPVWGREAIVQGIRRTFSLIRMAKDPQRLVNLYVSNIAEQIAMMPKAPYEAAVGSIAANHEGDWRDAGQTPRSILYYKAFDENGQPLPPPKREQAEPPIQALSIGLTQAIDAIKAAMGIYDASLGNRSNETSGVAIERRKKSAEIVNFHFSDNENRSRKAIGEILLEILPLLDKPGMDVPVRTEDGKTRLVPIGKPYIHPKTGERVIHAHKGNYGVVVSTGPSYDSARQEERDSLIEYVKAYPELFMVVGDQIITLSDFPGSQDMGDRMKNFIQLKNPGVIQDKQQQPLPPEVVAKFQQLQKELQTTQAFAQSLHEKLETKQPELDNEIKLKQMDLDFKREELAVKSTTTVAVEELKQGVTVDLANLHAEIDFIKHQMGLSAQQQQQQAEHEHAEEMADKTQAGVLEQQQQAADLAPKPEQGEA